MPVNGVTKILEKLGFYPTPAVGKTRLRHQGTKQKNPRPIFEKKKHFFVINHESSRSTKRRTNPSKEQTIHPVQVKETEFGGSGGDGIFNPRGAFL